MHLIVLVDFDTSGLEHRLHFRLVLVAAASRCVDYAAILNQLVLVDKVKELNDFVGRKRL